MQKLATASLVLSIFSANIMADGGLDKDDVLVYTVATSMNDGFRRYIFTTKQYEINSTVLGIGQEFKGAYKNTTTSTGGAWKVNLLKQALKEHNNNSKTIVLFTDCYNVMFLSNISTIKPAFVSTGLNILFSADDVCWPDKSLKDDYPTVRIFQKRFLNSGMFIGYLSAIRKLLNRESINNSDDDQLFFTRAFLDAKFRTNVKMGLDIYSDIFHNINGAANDVELSSYPDEMGRHFLKTVFSLTTPMVVRANAESKLYLNSLSNYLGGTWTAKGGCEYCNVNTLSLDQNFPTVLLALFTEQPTPFLREQLELIQQQFYPTHKIHLYIHNIVKYHSTDFNIFVKKYGKLYASITQFVPEDKINETKARELALDHCRTLKCEYYFSVDSIVQLNNPYTLRLLIEQNRIVVAPMITQPGALRSNFWGALSTNGYYARSADYMEIVTNQKNGLWNVPYVAHCYLLNATLLNQYDESKINYSRRNLDPNMAFCANLRDIDVFLYVSNRLMYGHLVNTLTYNINLVEPEIYQIFDNEYNWQNRFLHPNYFNTFRKDKPEQPCPDVYLLPVVTRRFCKSLIRIVESNGNWSDGTYGDYRLANGDEEVPTVNIHMNQVGWDAHWMYFLNNYVRPLQEHVYNSSLVVPIRSNGKFVVRYKATEQTYLKPHHDQSTFTINLALNEPKVDFQGGGCRFLRYNCTVSDTPPGWVLMHPGKLTHLHEGLKITDGTRYIFVSLLNP